MKSHKLILSSALAEEILHSSSKPAQSVENRVINYSNLVLPMPIHNLNNIIKVLTFKTSDSTEFTADVYCAVMFTVVLKE
jgi:hypothetical protein